jgi:hypothetical protein
MIGDHYSDKWRGQPWTQPNPPALGGAGWAGVFVSRHEFDKLKAEVEDMKALLARAKAYDERNNEPDCEMDEKMDLLRKVAKLVGISLDDVIGKPAKGA